MVLINLWLAVLALPPSLTQRCVMWKGLKHTTPAVIFINDVVQFSRSINYWYDINESIINLVDSC